MEKLLFFAPIVLCILIGLVASYFIYLKTRKKKWGFLPTVILMVVGLVFLIIAYILAKQDSDAWVDLAMIILGMVYVLSIGSSAILTFLLMVFIDKRLLFKNRPQGLENNDK